MNFLEPILYGFGFGFLLTFVTGPAFFALVKTSIENGFRAGALLATGVFLSDVFYISLVLWGANKINVSDDYKLLFGIFGGLFLVALGIYYFFKKAKKPETKVSKMKHTGYLIKGILLNGFNPFIIIYWFSVVSYLKFENNFTNLDLRAFFIATLLTVISVDLLKAKYASYLGERFGLNLMKKMSKIAGIAITLFGIYLVFKSVTSI